MCGVICRLYNIILALYVQKKMSIGYVVCGCITRHTHTHTHTQDSEAECVRAALWFLYVAIESGRFWKESTLSADTNESDKNYSCRTPFHSLRAKQQLVLS